MKGKARTTGNNSLSIELGKSHCTYLVHIDILPDINRYEYRYEQTYSVYTALISISYRDIPQVA